MAIATEGGSGPLQILHALKKVADGIGVLLFVVAFSGFAVQIFCRYVLNSPLLWTEEVMMIAFIWAVFWAAAFTVQIRDHVTFDVLYDIVSPETRRLMAIFSMLVLIIGFGLLIPATWDYMVFLLRKKSPVLRIPMTWVYGCYLLFIVNFSIQAAWRLGRLFSSGWREHV